jgi:oligopeptide/dipeptide ABC transporter ATP-binding protein
VDGVSLEVARGEALGLVGESGCGKSTLGRLAIRLLEPTAGSVLFEGRDLARVGKEDLRALRKRMQIIFQDPFASLNPRRRIQEIITEPLIIHGMAKANELPERGAALLQKVGLPADALKRYPHEFSGGQRQRVGIARSLASGPSFIVADEAVSALDVSVQAQIVNLLQDLRDEFKLSFLFIAHDLNIVRHFSDRVAVMYLGRIVEIAPAEEIYRNPSHPYTEALLADIPVADPTVQKKHILLKGDIPSPTRIPPGCRFHTRCIYRFEPCDKIVPRTTDLGNGHFVECHLRG